MVASLNFPNADQELAAKRQQYQYNYDHIPSVAMVDQLPYTEKFSRPWLLLLAKVGFNLLVNTIIVNRGDRGKPGFEDDVKEFFFAMLKKTLKEQGFMRRLKIYSQVLPVLPKIAFGGIPDNAEEAEELLRDLTKAVSRNFLQDLAGNIQEELKLDTPKKKVTSLDDYKALFATMPLPDLAHTYDTDEMFAYMRVAGPNPLMIQQMTQLDPRFRITNDLYQSVMGHDDSLETAMAEGRLYWADYGILSGAIAGNFPSFQKYVYAPIALFAVPKSGDQKLKPVAIQCDQTADSPIFTPHSNQYAWLAAKSIVQTADANFHEAVSHLARTHLFVGPFVIATHRQLPEAHPISLLLRPHFQGTLAINDSAQSRLIYKGGGVDKLLSCVIDQSRLFAIKGVHTYGFNSAFFEDQLRLRGVDDRSCLPVYPFRDDGQLIWDAILQWVSDYVNLYYDSDAAIQGDRYLQNWAKELVDYNGGRVIDFGETNGKIETKAYLIKALTLVIFTGSAQHAAVNFPQKDVMSYAPSMPMAGYVPVTHLQENMTEQDYLDQLPPLSQAQEQLKLLHLLGCAYFTQLGQYEPDHFGDRQVQTPLKAFQDRLKQIEDEIQTRNLNRPIYYHLLPSKIPQSINI